MPRDYNRERSPTSHPGDRKYRDRSDAPKRKAGEISNDTQPRKKIQLPARDNKYPSVNELKKRIRDVNRLLKRVDLPADARIVQERALAGYEKELADEMKRRDRSKMIKKYHFVRFLDRKTATKEVTRLTRREQEISESELDLETKERKLASNTAKLHLARVNLNYTIYYPLNEKYLSIYPGKNDNKKENGGEEEEDDDDDDDGSSANDDGEGKAKKEEKTAAKKKAMWQVVEKCMEDRTLDLLRDGKLKQDANANAKKASGASAERKEKKNKSKHDSSVQKPTEERAKRSRPGPDNIDGGRGKDRKQAFTEPARQNDDDDESDGGFFEL